MLVGGSRRHYLNPSEKKALSLMAKDAGEGGISDGGDSLDEITAEDFRHDARGSRSRVWMPSDLMRYPVSRNFASDIYSFAWAQAVQSKPKPPPVDSDELELDAEVIAAADTEKEEGELEEGEIEIGYEPAVSDELELESAPEPESAPEMAEAEETDDDFDTRVGLILEELEAVTGEEAEISFDIVCSRLRKSFESLKEMFSDGRIPVLDALVQQAFMGIQTLHSVISSRNLKEKERNEDLFLRLLIHLKKQYSLLLTPEQIKEIDDMLQSLALDNKEKGSSKSNDATKHVLVPTVATRNRVEFSPLVDLHAEYDEGNFPSPTRENAFPIKKPVGFGTAAPAPNKPLPVRKVEAKDGTLHSYDTDAFKAVSFYQQKYSRNSSVASTGLWSPTPSEESEGNDDTNGEVSSSSVTTLNSGSILQLHGSTNGAQTSSLKPKALTNCRDPRLRILNPEAGSSHACSSPSNGFPGVLMNSRKHKAVDDPVMVDQLFKKLRNATDSREAQRTSGKGGWLEEANNVAREVESRKLGNGEIISSKIQEANTNYNGFVGPNQNPNPNPIPSAAAARAVMLPSLLKDVAVNPTILLQLIKMEQQRLAADSLKKPADSVPAAASSGNVAPMKPSELEQKPAGKSQMPTLLASMGSANDVGRIRMKPRDPRRVLHNNTVQKGESLKPEPTKINDRLTIREQGEQAQTAGLPSHPSAQPDIGQLFTTNLKSIADILSSSQSGSTPPVVPQNQTVPNVVNRVDPKSPDFNIQKSTPCDGAASQDPNHWENVDHLLDGYDDQEKAAIQKERARRIEEQNKMFSSRKLCLVLDLDHTLLNSAKFLEVDPIHDEILRKKEEQDREKPQRHLFRFQHMAMWTKLRPGIWTFLERASKLYELHLYTMGNKLYATEMAKVLDPTGRLFAGRVISRGDEGDALDGEERVPRSKDLDGVLGMESAVVIIDDSVRVWPLNKLNLIVVERYTYFPYSRRQFGLPGPSLLEIDHDERPEDGTLASSLAVIERIHHSFFSHRSLNDVDVRNILAAEQRKILSGCKIVFSRIFPVGEMNPHLHPLWQTAEQFGAVCTSQIDELVTHVVANSLGTDKVNWALSTGRFAVQPGWVEASALLYRRANEQDFAIKL